MSIPSSAELLLMDTHPQQTDMYLSIYEPNLAMMCQITGTYDSANQTLSYMNVVSGSYANIDDYRFQVALIGSTPNSDNYGRTWVRSATNSTLRFVESDHINWQAGAWITVLEYTEIIPVFPRIIQNPSNEEDVIFYKIWDVAYTNQNSILGTFPCMGSNYAGFLENGTCNVYWTASGTSNLLNESLTYLWEFEGGTPTGSTAHTPGNVSYSKPGHYRTTLNITSTSGRTDTSSRYVSIYDRPGKGSKTPLLNFELSEFSGSRDGNGYSARIRLRDNIPQTKIRDGALVVLFKDDYYGDTMSSVNNNQLGRSKVFFTGYIETGSIQYNYRDSWVEFSVISPTKIMEMCECFSVSVESKTAPSKWYELLNMTVRRALYHYLAWHSTVLQCCDFIAPDDERNIQYFDADRTSLYDAINSLMEGALKGRIVSDRLGTIWAEKEYTVLPNARTAIPSILSIDKNDWIDEPTIDERQYNEVSFIEIGGISYEPSNNSFGAYLSDAPGVSPAYHGSVERIQGLALTGQSELNTLAGNLYANLNARYPSSEFRLRGNFANLDINRSRVDVTINSEDTPRGISFTNEPFSLRSVSWSWDARTKLLLPTVNLAQIVAGFDGDTIIIPVEPPEEGGGEGGGGNYNVPPITVPPLPVPIPAPIYTGTSIGSEFVLRMYSAYAPPSGPYDTTHYGSWVSNTTWQWGPNPQLVYSSFAIHLHNPEGMYDSNHRDRVTIKQAGVYLFLVSINPTQDNETDDPLSVMIKQYDSGDSVVHTSDRLWSGYYAPDSSVPDLNYVLSANLVFSCAAGDYIKIIHDIIGAKISPFTIYMAVIRL